MALYSSRPDVVPINGLHERNKKMPMGHRLRFELLLPTTKHVKRLYVSVAFLAGLLLGCVAAGRPGKERDVYSELAPATELAYKMKANLLKADLLLRGMDSVIENTNKNLYTEESK